jgi:hypothetical protein
MTEINPSEDGHGKRWTEYGCKREVCRTAIITMHSTQVNKPVATTVLVMWCLVLALRQSATN